MHSFLIAVLFKIKKQEPRSTGPTKKGSHIQLLKNLEIDTKVDLGRRTTSSSYTIGSSPQICDTFGHDFSFVRAATYLLYQKAGQM